MTCTQSLVSEAGISHVPEDNHGSDELTRGPASPSSPSTPPCCAMMGSPTLVQSYLIILLWSRRWAPTAQHSADSCHKYLLRLLGRTITNLPLDAGRKPSSERARPRLDSDLCLHQGAAAVQFPGNNQGTEAKALATDRPTGLFLRPPPMRAGLEIARHSSHAPEPGPNYPGSAL